MKRRLSLGRGVDGGTGVRCVCCNQTSGLGYRRGSCRLAIGSDGGS